MSAVVYPQEPPAWYWVRGLHDACVVATEVFDHVLILTVNGKNALYDRDVKKIRLYGYEILTPEIHLQGRRRVWWMADRLHRENDEFLLEIDLKDLDSDPEEFVFRVRFSHGEVER